MFRTNVLTPALNMELKHMLHIFAYSLLLLAPSLRLLRPGLFFFLVPARMPQLWSLW